MHEELKLFRKLSPILRCRCICVCVRMYVCMYMCMYMCVSMNTIEASILNSFGIEKFLLNIIVRLMPLTFNLLSSSFHVLKLL